jgi:hypothetical protein
VEEGWVLGRRWHRGLETVGVEWRESVDQEWGAWAAVWQWWCHGAGQPRRYLNIATVWWWERHSRDGVSRIADLSQG